MSKKYLATIANFNCTFKYDKETYGMLDYFEDIIWPSFVNKELIRVTKNKERKTSTRFHLADIRLTKLDDGNMALTGKHVKRTLLDISPDYNPEEGFFGDSETRPSAPYSTFIILLSNHRVIYFPNKPGAPDIRSFASTVGEIIKQHIKENRSRLRDMLLENDYTYNGVRYKYIQDFTNEVLEKYYPFPEINIIPIESPDLVKDYFDNISTINKVTFKFYKPNNEPINFNNFFAHSMTVLDSTGSESLQQILSKPTEKNVIQSALVTSEGKTDYTIDAKNIENEQVKLTPDKVTQKIPVKYDEEIAVELGVQEVYNQVKSKKIVSETSEENLSIFRQLYDYLTSLL